MDFFFDNLEGRLSSTLPHYDRPDGDEQDCRKRARDAEWNFRCLQGLCEGHLLELALVPPHPLTLSVWPQAPPRPFAA